MKIDPVWFATVMILATQVGVITPPFALAIYAVNAVADPDVSIEEIPRGTTPFLVLMIVALIITIFVPAISAWIPDRMYQL
jgi:C4-dicarboxylate transporter DctM subunit